MLFLTIVTSYHDISHFKIVNYDSKNDKKLCISSRPLSQRAGSGSIFFINFVVKELLV